MPDLAARYALIQCTQKTTAQSAEPFEALRASDALDRQAWSGHASEPVVAAEAAWLSCLPRHGEHSHALARADGSGLADETAHDADDCARPLNRWTLSSTQMGGRR